jgi:hypothetical protein
MHIHKLEPEAEKGTNAVGGKAIAFSTVTPSARKSGQRFLTSRS